MRELFFQTTSTGNQGDPKIGRSDLAASGPRNDARHDRRGDAPGRAPRWDVAAGRDPERAGRAHGAGGNRQARESAFVSVVSVIAITLSAASIVNGFERHGSRVAARN